MPTTERHDAAATTSPQYEKVVISLVKLLLPSKDHEGEQYDDGVLEHNTTHHPFSLSIVVSHTALCVCTSSLPLLLFPSVPAIRLCVAVSLFRGVFHTMSTKFR